MTYKELEEEARQMGYILVPKYKPHTKVMLCICGMRPKVARTTRRSYTVWCKRCKRKVTKQDNCGRMTQWNIEEAARICWNEMIKEEENLNHQITLEEYQNER